MEPRIQYAKTKDGASIAFYTIGEGMPYVCMPIPPWSHIQQAWEWPGMRRWNERLAAKRKLILYDNRGSGLSDRDVAGHSLDAHMLDLHAVVDRLGLEQFALQGTYHSGPVAIAYATRHPERVSHLVLLCSIARAPDYSQRPQTRAFRPLIDEDWELFIKTRAHFATGFSEGGEAHRMAAFMRECVTPEAAKAIYGAIDEFDVTDLLPKVRCPTLVLHRRHVQVPDVSVARGLASQIPDARLALLEGASLLMSVGDMESVANAIDEFLGEREKAPVPAPSEAGASRTILFTDVADSTPLTQRLGDAKAREVLREHERIVRGALKSHGGSEVKTMGDGFMTSFSSATRALECAIAMQRAFARQNASVVEPVLVRVGLNAGEPIEEEEDLFGTSVIMAARIAAKAQGGEILTSNVVRELVAGKGFLFADRGDVALRGFEDPVRLYEVRWREDA